jgi:phosphate transport system substrate-binding protein
VDRVRSRDGGHGGGTTTSNEGVATLVTQTAGSIGYVEFIYAVRSHIGYGRVRNRHGESVAASLESIAAAASPAITADALPPSIIDSPAAGAYPITSFAWLAVPRRIADGDKRTALTDFLGGMLNAGQRQAAALGYLALPNAVAAQAAAAVTQIR